MYKRDEAFRFAFDEPISTSFAIKQVGEQMVSIPEGEGEIVNLSPNGLQFRTSLEITLISDQPVFSTFRFLLNDQEHYLQGEIVWKKHFADQYYYGVSFDHDEHEQKQIIEAIKQLREKGNTM
ncbi:hypothetical protein J416_11947 [Gracilibacillus halophilus YIM-C55.5]|uniref:PilZ domain-containing protein n=1 Tax=Gracilibacillus halophilus YIM-C55.5 TaxID=1308866 RepID=N4WP01_9BACI|nr:PilZ domain-containing protein [Gracilibacillus halophilus]ENH96215.1 hypothetical protein J416_11947 [Gracilibacillus halophilus YIM-C55.5]